MVGWFYLNLVKDKSIDQRSEAEELRGSGKNGASGSGMRFLSMFG